MIFLNFLIFFGIFKAFLLYILIFWFFFWNIWFFFRNVWYIYILIFEIFKNTFWKKSFQNFLRFFGNVLIFWDFENVEFFSSKNIFGWNFEEILFWALLDDKNIFLWLSHLVQTWFTNEYYTLCIYICFTKELRSETTSYQKRDTQKTWCTENVTHILTSILYITVR